MPLIEGTDEEERLRRIDAAAMALHASRAWTAYSAESLARSAWEAREVPNGPMHGLAVSVKDLMDMAGWPTTCGGSRTGEAMALASHDAAFVQMWRRRGAWMVGKTHLNEHAYGLTGENPWWGDCTVPGDASRLTGGSSSGAAASVLGGAADVGLGTDTGGSLRVPASLCGLASLRAPGWFARHEGVRPLAPSFDALGWISRDVEGLANVAGRLRGEPVARVDAADVEVVLPDVGFLAECDGDVMAAWAGVRGAIEATGARVRIKAGDWLGRAAGLFGPLQAREAWRVHEQAMERDPGAFGDVVRQRLAWGRSIDATEENMLRVEARAFRQAMREWMGTRRVLALPACAVTRLASGGDHVGARGRILRLTTPASVAGLPVVTQPLPWANATHPVGIQWIGRENEEGFMVGWAACMDRAWSGSRRGQHGQNATRRSRGEG